MRSDKRCRLKTAWHEIKEIQTIGGLLNRIPSGFCENASVVVLTVWVLSPVIFAVQPADSCPGRHDGTAVP
jgi:hypothetical protein